MLHGYGSDIPSRRTQNMPGGDIYNAKRARKPFLGDFRKIKEECESPCIALSEYGLLLSGSHISASAIPFLYRQNLPFILAKRGDICVLIQLNLIMHSRLERNTTTSIWEKEEEWKKQQQQWQKRLRNLGWESRKCINNSIRYQLLLTIKQSNAVSTRLSVPTSAFCERCWGRSSCLHILLLLLLLLRAPR